MHLRAPALVIGERSSRGRAALDEDGAGPIEVLTGAVWLATELPDGLYFLGERRLFRVGRDGEADSWPLPGDAQTGLRVGDELWARVEGQGLMRFDGKGFVAVPGGAEFIAFGVQSSAPHAQGTLFTSRAKGLYLGDATRGLRHVETTDPDRARAARSLMTKIATLLPQAGLEPKAP